jgi:hypothetical protein
MNASQCSLEEKRPISKDKTVTFKFMEFLVSVGGPCILKIGK